MAPSPTSALTGQISWFYFTHPFGKEHKDNIYVGKKRRKFYWQLSQLASLMLWAYAGNARSPAVLELDLFDLNSVNDFDFVFDMVIVYSLTSFLKML